MIQFNKINSENLKNNIETGLFLKTQNFSSKNLKFFVNGFVV